MTAYLNKEAFVLGETIRLRIDITNLSRQSIEQLSVDLKMVITVSMSVIVNELLCSRTFERYALYPEWMKN